MTGKTELKICLGSSCFARGNKEILKIVKAFVVKHKLESSIDFRGNHCFNKCLNGPNIKIGDHFFQNITADNIEQILKDNLLSL